jgi:hypothetical protein
MRRVVATAIVVTTSFIVSASDAGGPLPPIDTRCAADADCGVTFLSLDPGPYQCCTACGTSTAGNKSWVTSVDAACRVVIARERCPVLACPSGPRLTTCDRGMCKLVTH